MRFVMMVHLILICALVSGQTTQTPEQIRKEMARIRQTTNWEDPAAAKRANEQIRELSKKLMGMNSGAAGSPGQGQQAPENDDAGEMMEMNQEMIDQKMDVWAQIMKSAAGGKGADILLAEPLREEIVQEFLEDESPTASNTEYLEEKTILIIDMSLPTAQLLIDQMENYKSIETLVITGGRSGALVNLNDILTRAAQYPLKELYIINFRHFVTSVPQKIGNFSSLTLLALFNNQITKLPPGVASLSSLKNFYVDMNPIETLESVISPLSLDTLGVAKTQIPAEELLRIGTAQSKCKILTQ